MTVHITIAKWPDHYSYRALDGSFLPAEVGDRLETRFRSHYGADEHICTFWLLRPDGTEIQLADTSHYIA